jgi:hypothetical protein
MKRNMIAMQLCLLALFFMILMSCTSAYAVSYKRISSGGTAAASSYSSSSYYPSYAFDWNFSTKWFSDGAPPDWLQYKLAASRAVSAYQIYPWNSGAYFAPKSWYFQAYNGSSWVTLDTQTNQTGWVAGTAKTFYISNTTPYQYYRLYITATNPTSDCFGYYYYTSISEFALYTHYYPVINNYTASDYYIDIGQTATLNWKVYYGWNVTVGGVSVGTSGSKNVSPLVETTYALTAQGAGGSTSANRTVHINPPSFTNVEVSRSSCISGDDVTIYWAATNVASVSIDPGGVVHSNSPAVASDSGQFTITPTETTTYQLTCSGPGGTAYSDEFTVTVYADELDSDSDGLPDWYEIDVNKNLDNDESSGDCDCD